MKRCVLNSYLATQIAAFIDLRQLSGTDYHSQAKLLSLFDRFLVEQKVQQPRITREICDRYEQSLKRLCPRSQSNRLCVVRQLCKYLARKDLSCYIPEPLRRTASQKDHHPCIFSHEQVGALLAASLTLPPRGSLRPHTYETLLGLLYSTGIRIGEAIGLNIEHFFPADQRLYIAEGKFRKSRWIVLSTSTSCALEKYLDRRISKEPNAPDAPLLLNERCRRLSYPAVRSTYCGLLRECGMLRDSSKGPRIHDLRHSFAVHRLLAWYRDGVDVNARLPALATYMGHVSISSTQVYLQPTTELLGEVDRRFRDHFLNHLTSKGVSS